MPAMKLDDLVGQEELKQGLRALVEAARLEKRPLDHILLVGRRGAGKASFAQAAANELGVQLKTAPMEALNDPVQLVEILTVMPIRGILLIEGVMNLSQDAGQVLSRFVTEPHQEVLARTGDGGRSVRLRLPPFSVIGTAEDLPTIPSDVVRHVRIFALQPYTARDLQEVVVRAASAAGMTIEGRAAQRIASHAEGSPAQALALFRRVCSHLAPADRITVASTRDALTSMGYA